MSSCAVVHSAPVKYLTSSSFNQNEELDLTLVSHYLEKHELEEAAAQIRFISNVYSKNIGYLLVSLAYLTKLNVSEAQSQLRNVVLANHFDGSWSAKSAVEKVITIVKEHLTSSSEEPAFPPETRNLVLDLLHSGRGVIQEAILGAMDKIDSQRQPEKHEAFSLHCTRTKNFMPLRRGSDPLDTPRKKDRCDEQLLFALDD